LRPLVAGLEKRLLLSSAGDLDSTFGVAGVAEIQFAPEFPSVTGESADAVAVDSSGNVVVAGFVISSSGNSAAGSAAVARLTPDGSLDENFAPGGQVTISSVGGSHYQQGKTKDVVDTIVQDSEGNILLNHSDNSRIGSNTNYLVLAGSEAEELGNVNITGAFSLDALASSSGGQFTGAYGSGPAQVSFLPFNSQQNTYVDIANSGLLQPDGTILLTGGSTASDDQIPLARFAIDGSLDKSFGPSVPQPGTELLDIPGETSNSNFQIDPISPGAAMAFQGSAHIVLADTALIGSQYYAMVVRLNSSDDTIDSSFGYGNDGVTMVPVPSGGTVAGIAVDPASDRIIVAGSNYLVALTPSGQPDSTFGPSSNGVVSIVDMTANAVAIQSDSKIVVAGSSASGIAALARYNINGAQDTTFGPDGTGLVTTDIDGSGSSAFYAVTMQPSDGEIVAAGTALDPKISSQATVVARYFGETPEITELSPTSAGVGGASFTLTVTGSNFVSASTVDWNGSALVTTYENATTLSATVPASDLTQAGTAKITVVSPGNVASKSVPFSVGGAPAITALNPSAGTQGEGQFTITVTGSNFVSASTVDWNGSALVTAFGNATTLTATVPASDLTQAGTANITVVSPGNVVSNSESFIIGGVPAITALNPPAGTQGEGQFTITVTGSNFVSASTVDWNGSALVTTFANATTLTATVPASDLTQAGTANVTVVSPGNVASNSETFTIGGTPAITALNPPAGTQGEGQFTLTVTGSNFVSASTVDLNGSALVTTYGNATTLTATVPASDLTQASTANVTVVSPGNVASNSEPFIIGGVPAITALNPAAGTQGEGQFTLTVSGSNFVSASTVDWNGSALVTTYGNATTLTATVPASDLTQAGTANITVVSPGNVASNSESFIIGGVPAITALNPSTGTQGEGQFTLTVTGINFVSASTVDWNGSALMTTFGNATTLTATVPASDLTQAGTANVTVVRPGSVASNSESFIIGGVPAITALNPSAGTQGEGQFTLTVTGNNFVSASTVDWNGSALVTTYENATTLTATVPASDLTQAGTANITVVSPGNVASNSEAFTTGPPPSITSLSPASGTQGEGAFTLTVTGVNFVTGSTVDWNGSALAPTIFNSTTSLTATVPASDLAQAGTASITVVNPGGVASSAAQFPIGAPPSITSLSPASGTQGEGAFTLTVTGVNFVTGSTIDWNGSALAPTTFNSTTSLTATVPAADLTQAGTASITVVNPGGLASSAAQFPIGAPPIITSLSPASATQGVGPLSLTVTGTNFVSGSLVLWNGMVLRPNSIGNGSLKVTIPTSDLAHAGTATVAVTNPGNVTSNTQLFTIIGKGPPAVTGVAIGSQTPSGLVSIVVSYNEPMSVGSVQNASLYTVLGAVTVKKTTKFSKKLGFRVAYNAKAMTATLTLSAAYKGNVQVTVKTGMKAANGLSTKQSAPKVLA
jgi:uncharacterized delta-60 repeat protein